MKATVGFITIFKVPRAEFVVFRLRGELETPVERISTRVLSVPKNFGPLHSGNSRSERAGWLHGAVATGGDDRDRLQNQ